MEDIRIINIGSVSSPTTQVSIRCSRCHQRVVLETLPGMVDLTVPIPVPPKDTRYVIYGLRRCPDPDCRRSAFFAYDSNNKKIIASYPPEGVDFDSLNIPDLVLRPMEEAVDCHSNQLYMAAGMMIRKTMEAICEDRGAKGKNLKERIKNLRTVVVLPNELMDGIDELRILGNDAAHIESKDYDKIGQDEIEIGIDLAREILKAVYQHASLIQKIKDLKKKPV